MADEEYAIPKQRPWCGDFPDDDVEPTTKEQFLNKIFRRDIQALFPSQRVFLPIWKEAGQLHGVIRVDARDIPRTSYKDGEVPPGEVVEQYAVHRGIVMKLEQPSDHRERSEARMQRERRKAKPAATRTKHKH